ncbi:hypothetical protein AAVH_25195 [Aphelenchoides avenae]|nr:hypothetical protein AAVH_25195 [Aphelenchus avenae]
MADRFQAHKLVDICVNYLLTSHKVPPFVAQLEVADELSMTQLRDRLVKTATKEELTEAANTENEEKFSAQTWMKLFLKYRELRPPV